MARTVRDAKLESRAARSSLKARGKPYYRSLDEGLHIGYRKSRGGAGKWVVRYYAGAQTYQVETIAAADDLSDANGADVLSFAQAQAEARKRRDQRSRTAAGITGPFTVDAAATDYLLFLEHNKKTAGDARYRYEALIKPSLGKIEVAALTAKKIRDWHQDLAKAPVRLRTAKGEDQKHAKLGKDDETKRRRRVTANRVLAILKAMLNRAWREGNVHSDEAWRRVQPFKGVNAARIRYLTIADAKRFLNACDPDFRKLVQAALETGARYSELARLTVADFHSDTGTVAIRISKTGTSRHVVLTDEGQAFFRQVCVGRAGTELMLTKANGREWLRSHQTQPMTNAVRRAKISPAIGFHGLRHTWASLAVMAGVPLLVVAKNLGHSDTRMVERHYGHLAPSYIADAIRAGAPKFGFKPDKTLVTLRIQ
jgi:integrase